jgi:hypothetical protein
MDEKQKMKEARKVMEAFDKQIKQSQNPIISPVSSNEFDNQGGEFASYGDGNSIGMGFDNQGDQSNNPAAPINIQTAVPKTHTQPTPEPIQRSDLCPQCGSLHPPLKPGEKCPNASVGDVVSEVGLDDTVINRHLVDIRNIILSNITSKEITDGKKFFQYAIIELTKSLEKYSE